VRLAEFVERRDVGDAVFEAEILEPRRVGDVEMIDGVQIVIEARRRDFFRGQAAAILQAPVDQQNVQARFRQIAAEDQPVMAGADDDAVIGLCQSLGHAVLPPLFAMERTANLRV
jgi:hypothetical protein